MTNIKAYDYFLDLASKIQHGHGDYAGHCLTVYTTLKNRRFPEHVCIAGLFHSVYGTESFNAGLTVTREQIKEVIGEEAEQLAFAFCTLENRDLYILDNFAPNDPLFEIAFANLQAQQLNNNDPMLANLVNSYKERRGLPVDQPKTPYDKYTLNDKDIFVFDGFLQKNYIEVLNDICMASSYRVDHGTSLFTYERDERLACHFSKEDFYRFGLQHVVQSIVSNIKKTLYVGNYYINYYSHMAQTNKHCDSGVDETMTILIFPNKFWEDTWGGGIKFTNETDKFHYVFDFVPGRVIVFDSRLEHEVLPLTINAKKSRFSIAIKCSTEIGKKYLEKEFSADKLIEFKHE